MLNDRKASELVTKSLRRTLTDALTDEESDALEKNLTDSKELEAFAKLSHKIQISAVEIATLAEHGDVTIGPGLSGEARDRLKDSICAVRMAFANDNWCDYAPATIYQWKVRFIDAAAALRTTMTVYFIEEDQGHLMTEGLQ